MSDPNQPIPDQLVLNAAGYASCDAAEWIAAWAAGHGFDDDAQFAMRLCIEELVTNWVHHGLVQAPQDHLVHLKAWTIPEGAVVDILDDGKPFDIATAPEPEHKPSIEEASIGGRGIRLMRAFSHHIDWKNEKGGNHTTFTFTTTTVPLATAE